MIRVLLVDDHPRVRRAIRRLLERSGEVEVIAEAADGKQALEQLENSEPDAIILDVQMPRMDGFSLLERLKTCPARPKIIVLSMFTAAETRRNALAAGAHGFVAKQEAYHQLLPTLRAALAAP